MKAIKLIFPAAFLVLFAWFIWTWGFCRFYVEPDQMAIVIAKSGRPLPAGKILADPGEQGVQAQVLGEGRHFLNPYFFAREIQDTLHIPPGKVGIVTAKVGTNLPAGEFLASPGQKGIWKNVLGPGRYRLNPYGYEVAVVDALQIPIGFDGVVTSLSGEQAPEGRFAQDNQKGIRHDVLQPGLYYINPKEYKVDVLEVGVNQVSLLGKVGSEINIKRVNPDVIANTLNAKAQEQIRQYQTERLREEAAAQNIAVVRDAPSQRAAGGYQVRGDLSGRADRKKAQGPAMANMPEPAAKPGGPDSNFILAQFVNFPSRDGFDINLDMTVEFELPPEKLAQIFRNYGDLPAVVSKIIMPQILSVSRLKGSAYRATDFIYGEGREKFQQDLTATLKTALGERQIVVHNALIRHVNVPDQILNPIQQASIAKEQDLTNREKQNTAKRQAELNTELSLIEQNRGQVQQETEKLKAEIRAGQEKQVAEIGAETLRQTADIERQTASVRAEKILKLGKAQADITRMVDGEKANGYLLRAQAFGDPASYAYWKLAENLNPDLKVTILHSGPGTLWTDLDKSLLGQLGGAKMLKSGN